MDLGTTPRHVAPRRPRPALRLALVALGAAVTVAAVGAFLVRRNGEGDQGVILLAAAETPENPWFPDLGPAEPTSAGDSAEGVALEPEALEEPVLLAGGQVVGTEAGLYAGTRDQALCDLEGLAELLAGDTPSGRADAWFEAVGRHVDGREEYVGELTAVRLRFDTRVTAHAVDGPDPAVLQAGTPVVIDRFGVPRALCAGGGPLSEAEVAPDGTDAAASLDVTRQAQDAGAAWAGFDPAAVLVVTAGASAVEAFDLADVAGGEMFTRPVGTSGDQDRGHWTGPTPDECEGCHAMSIVIETVSGTPARITYGGVDDPLRRSTTEVAWAGGTIEPGKPQVYEISHDYVRYMDIDPDRPTDMLYFDDPRYEDEVLFQDFAEGVVTECLPGDVRVTITVDDVEVQSTTESISCDIAHPFTFTPG